MSKSRRNSLETLESLESLDTAVEELVKQSRLNQIEKELKSSGAIIDNRKLYDLVEPPKRFFRKHENNEEINKKPILRRKGLTESSLKKEKDHAITMLKETGGILPDLFGDFLDEEMLWRTKSTDMKYTLRRKYDHPELQEYYDNMTTAEHHLFKDHCREAVIDLARKFREQVELERTKMDNVSQFVIILSNLQQ